MLKQNGGSVKIGFTFCWVTAEYWTSGPKNRTLAGSPGQNKKEQFRPIVDLLVRFFLDLADLATEPTII